MTTQLEDTLNIIGLTVGLPLSLLFAWKLIRLCFHDADKFTYPVEAQYEYLSVLVGRYKDSPSQLESIYKTATLSLKWQREKQPVCPDKYYRLHLPGKDTHGREFGTLYIRRDKV